MQFDVVAFTLGADIALRRSGGASGCGRGWPCIDRRDNHDWVAGRRDVDSAKKGSLSFSVLVCFNVAIAIAATAASKTLLGPPFDGSYTLAY